ncbi:lysophospholipid acyltransferase family protein [Wenzhouxiangella sp. XN201]|uniref:lysophospholipid acyltransferase family protein n=1 Tax=Wenzhouxiangella sp. XN201 TaxID=2710755 RepID=UPI0013C71793|nr:lysophospholipid acyltransferase family protein [Wenzhouxiangella sp. XN201]NEZ04474.1 lysophospholipid acyltransferase family protein [Wenzhouxiangella sp. XN201]
MKVRIILALLRLLSWMPLRLLHGLAVPLAWLARWTPWRGHDVARTNLALCFPDLSSSERERLYRQHLREMMRLVLESGAIWYWPGDRLQRHVRQVDGWEAVVRAANNGRGVLLVGAHFGNWEIMPLWVSLQREFTALYKAPRQAEYDRQITRSRERFGAQLVASGSPAMRRLLAGLRRGELIGLLADQQPKQGEGVFVDFFGQPALTMTLVNRLARRTGCAVLFASAERLPGRGWHMRFEPAPAAIADEDPALAMAAMHAWLEAEVQRNPAQYLWNYKRFSRQPDDQPSPYPARDKGTRKKEVDQMDLNR